MDDVFLYSFKHCELLSFSLRSTKFSSFTPYFYEQSCQQNILTALVANVTPTVIGQ